MKPERGRFWRYFKKDLLWPLVAIGVTVMVVGWLYLDEMKRKKKGLLPWIHTVGRSAKIAEEVHRSEYGRYTDDLGELLRCDRNLTDDPQVTFEFGACNTEGFTLTVRHARLPGEKRTFRD